MAVVKFVSKTPAGPEATTKGERKKQLIKIFLGPFLVLWAIWILLSYPSKLSLRHADKKPSEDADAVWKKITAAEQGVSSNVSVTLQPKKPVGSRRPKSSKLRNICWKPQCIALAEIISGGLGKRKPCQDFHGYVCGGKEHSKRTTPSNPKDLVIRALQGILKYVPRPKRQNFTSSDKFITAYKSCAIGGYDKQRYRLSIKKILGGWGFEDWPIIKKEPVGETSGKYQRIFGQSGLRPFFDYNVKVRPNGKNRMSTITITKPRTSSILVGTRREKTSSNDIDRTRKTSEPKNKNVHATDQQLIHYKEFIVQAINLLNPNVTRPAAVLVADGILLVETALAKLSARARFQEINLNDISSGTYLLARTVTMQALQKDLAAAGIRLTEDVQVTLQHPDYYIGVHYLISSVKDITPIRNFVAWTLILSLAEAEGTPLHDLYSQYAKSAFGKATQTQGDYVGEACLRQLLHPHVMHSAGASTFIKYKFDKYDRDYVKKMLTFVKASIERIVALNEWMSDATKRKVTQRLSNMKAIIGYPDWMLDDAVVNEEYRFIPNLSENVSYVEHYFWMKQNYFYQTLQKLKPDFVDKEYSFFVLYSHAFYIERIDTLVYPAAALISHYKRPPMPRSLNFGTIGTFLGLLIANALDRFDEKIAYIGNKPSNETVVEEFWDDLTRKNFCKASNCLKNEECTDKNEFKKTKSRALFRDYVAIRAAYMALRASDRNYTRPRLLPGTEFDAEEKIFFLALGNLFCPFRLPKNLVVGRSDSHLVKQPTDGYKERLNDVVKGYNGFRSAFKCGKIKEECRLMPPEIYAE
ncbi:neprilysin-2-like isoform X2 [Haemaphysalis longicornis]